MKRAAKWVVISVLVGGILLVVGKVAIQVLEKEANIGLATGELRQLGLAWRLYSEENLDESPDTIQDLIDSEIWDSNPFEYDGKPTCRAMEFPEFVYKGSVNSDEPDEFTVLARQKWCNTVELVLYASGNVERRKPQN